MKLVFW